VLATRAKAVDEEERGRAGERAARRRVEVFGQHAAPAPVAERRAAVDALPFPRAGHRDVKVPGLGGGERGGGGARLAAARGRAAVARERPAEAREEARRARPVARGGRRARGRLGGDAPARDDAERERGREDRGKAAVGHSGVSVRRDCAADRRAQRRRAAVAAAAALGISDVAALGLDMGEVRAQRVERGALARGELRRDLGLPRRARVAAAREV
jgi:hypothetical protein